MAASNTHPSNTVAAFTLPAMESPLNLDLLASPSLSPTQAFLFPPVDMALVVDDVAAAAPAAASPPDAFSIDMSFDQLVPLDVAEIQSLLMDTHPDDMVTAAAAVAASFDAPSSARTASSTSSCAEAANTFFPADQSMDESDDSGNASDTSSSWQAPSSALPAEGEEEDDDEDDVSVEGGDEEVAAGGDDFELRPPRAPKRELAQRPFAKRSKPNFYEDMTAKERSLIEKEGFKLPNRPLTKAEEKELKKVRRKVKNKISAQDSRKRRKEYVNTLESKVKSAAASNKSLKTKVTSLEKANRSLVEKMQELQRMLAKYTGKAAPSAGTALMILGLCFSLFVPPDMGSGSGIGTASAAPMASFGSEAHVDGLGFQSRTLKSVADVPAAGFGRAGPAFGLGEDEEERRRQGGGGGGQFGGDADASVFALGAKPQKRMVDESAAAAAATTVTATAAGIDHHGAGNSNNTDGDVEGEAWVQQHSKGDRMWAPAQMLAANA